MHKVLEKKQGEVKLELTVEKEALKKATDLVMEELGKNVKISGFRPGKAPQFMVEKEVGKDRFWAEVMDKALPEAFFEAVIAENLVTLTAPQISIKEFIPGEKLVAEAMVAVLPELKDFNYKGLKIKAKKEQVSAEDKKKALEELLKRYSAENKVDRAAKDGDKVEIDFEGTLSGLPFEGGKSLNHPVVLGSGMLIPGFEEKVVGKKAGEEFEFDITFPKDYHAKNLAGQKTHFKVKLNNVYENIPAEANDEFAKKFGVENMAKLKEELEKQLQFEKDLALKRETEEEILAKIIEKNKIEAPETLLAEETHRMIHEAEHNLSHSGLTMEQFLEMSSKTISDLEQEMKPEAERRVKIGIALGEVARQEGIKVEEPEIDAEIDKMVQMAGPEAPIDDLKAAYEAPEQKREIGNSIIIRKAMDSLWKENVVK
jgi:trigger factor